MRIRYCVGARPLVVALLLCCLSCFWPTQPIELSKSGGCPVASVGRRISVEGFFGVDPENGIATEGGVESMYPFARLAFSAEPGLRSEFEAALVMANSGLNGPERANRFVPAERGAQPAFHIYDNREQEISFKDRVRIVGVLIRKCVVKVERIEKL